MNNSKLAIWNDKESMAGKYSIVRYVPSFERGERLNIGIVVWGESRLIVQFDPDAVNRLRRDNRGIDVDSVLSLQYDLNEHLGSINKLSDAAVGAMLEDLSVFPLELSDPQFVAIPTQSRNALESILETLLALIVKPKKVGYARQPGDAKTIVEQALKQFVNRGLLERHYPVRGTSSGVVRYLDYFGNHGANVALEVLKLNVKSPEEIRYRADACANKMRDITHSNYKIDVNVLLDLPSSAELIEASKDAKSIIAETNVHLITNTDDAIKKLVSAVAN